MIDQRALGTREKESLSQYLIIHGPSYVFQ